MFQATNGWTKDKIKAHIRAEFKGKSINDKNSCLYRGPDGKKCGMGMFIPDNRYDPRMDHETANGAQAVIRSFNLISLMPLGVYGMEHLQSVHDSSNPAETLEKMLKFVDEQVED